MSNCQIEQYENGVKVTCGAVAVAVFRANDVPLWVCQGHNPGPPVGQAVRDCPAAKMPCACGPHIQPCPTSGREGD